MEMFSVLLALCEGKYVVTDGFHSQRASDADDVCWFVATLNK